MAISGKLFLDSLERIPFDLDTITIDNAQIVENCSGFDVGDHVI